MPQRRLLVRLGLAVTLGFLSHLVDWGWLCFATSEAILWISASLGLTAHRLTFDTIAVQGRYFQFGTSCTFIDVVVGSVPLIWRGTSTLSRNLLLVATTSGALLLVNIIRLQIAQILCALGAPWVVADSIFGGFSYFAVWLALVDRYSRNFAIDQRWIAGNDLIAAEGKMNRAQQ